MPIKKGEITTLDRAARRFVGGACLLGEAAREAETTTLELMEYLSDSGYCSPYSWEDFQRGLRVLDEFRDYVPPRARQGG